VVFIKGAEQLQYADAISELDHMWQSYFLVERRKCKEKLTKELREGRTARYSIFEREWKIFIFEVEIWLKCLRAMGIARFREFACPC
jgi:hypothetical protein